ncbi:putative protein arginine N-methyltransferase 6.1, partial [Araneus ventricosus]
MPSSSCQMLTQKFSQTPTRATIKYLVHENINAPISVQTAAVQKIEELYAVEASGIAREAQKVVASNGYANKITVIEDKIEDAKLPEKVDIIVSEWMGYMLMYESMLPSFLFARDKWLKKDGHLFPDEVKIYIAPIQDPQEYEYSVEFWKKVEDAYKVDMSALASVAAEQMR